MPPSNPSLCLPLALPIYLPCMPLQPSQDVSQPLDLCLPPPSRPLWDWDSLPCPRTGQEDGQGWGLAVWPWRTEQPSQDVACLLPTSERRDLYSSFSLPYAS